MILSMVLLGVFSVSAVSWNSTFANGLNSYFPFDSNYSDSLINSGNFDTFGTPVFRSGINGNSVSVNPADYLTSSTNCPLCNIRGNTTINATINFWFYSDNFTVNDAIYRQHDGYIVYATSPPRFYIADILCANLGYGTQDINSSSWNMFTYQRINSTTGNCYVNGNLDSTGTNKNGDSGAESLIYLGTRTSGFNTVQTTKYDEFYIWNRSLSDNEIKDLYNSGNGIFFQSNLAINFVSPTDENGDSYQRQNILVNVSSEGTENITINFYNSTHNLVASFSNSTSPFFKNYSTGTDGIFYFNATSCIGESCVSTETIQVNLDTFNPVVDIIYPDPDNSIFNYFVNTVNFTVLNTGSIDTCLVSVNGGANVSVPNCTEGNIMTYSGFNSTEGNNTITVWANDTVSLFGSHTHTYTVDTIPPTINIVSPINANYSGAVQMLNISTNGNTIIYNFDGTNHTYTVPVFVTFNEGSNILNVYAYDLAGNFNSTNVSFDVNTPIIVILPSVLSNPIYQVMNGFGSGLGIFILFMAQALPLLLIGLAFVGILVIVGYAIVNAIKYFSSFNRR